MPRYDEQGFNSKKRIENEKKDRSVPVDENYYNIQSPDLNFNNRESEEINTKEENEMAFDNPDYIKPYLMSDQMDKPIDSTNVDKNEYSDIMNYNNNSENQHTKNSKQKKKKSKGSKIVKILIPIVAVLLVLIIVPISMLNGIIGKLNYTEPNPMQIEGLYSENNVRNILLLGVDEKSKGGDGRQRSDSMMLITLDGKHHCIKMTSFLRDSWVYIPKIDKHQRLNASCSYGGYQGVVDTIEYNFGIKIDGYVVTDFRMFETLVDSIGGVEIEVTQKEAKEINTHKNRYGNVKIEAGKHNLTGKQALAYCRIRKIDTDFVRTQRQRTVITAIINKMKSSSPSTLYEMAQSAVPYVETTLSKSQIMSLGALALRCVTGEMIQSSVPYDDTWSYKTIQGNSVISIDVEKNKEMLKDNLYNKTTDEFKQANSKENKSK